HIMIGGVLKKIFGDKAEKDRKELLPIVEKINECFDEMESLSHDELRARSNDLRKRIADYVSEQEAERKSLDEKTRSTEIGVDEKTSLYDRIDEIDKE